MVSYPKKVRKLKKLVVSEWSARQI